MRIKKSMLVKCTKKLTSIQMQKTIFYIYYIKYIFLVYSV